MADAHADWLAKNGTRRLWERDASLWTGTDEAKWLGWLALPDQQPAKVDELVRLAGEICRDRMTDAVVLGMGGSSLCAFVMATIFEVPPGCLRMHVLDSTDPEQIRDLEASLDLSRTVFLVASKSGSTLEPSIMRDHFLAAVRAKVGHERAGRHFVAITDPGSQLEREATNDGFRAIVLGEPTVGGRFSALSPFGLLPAALMGIDVRALLARAAAMAAACRRDDLSSNPGVDLGLRIGAAAREGRDKLTLILSPRIMHLGAWLEQLIAESTGKKGVAILPVDREPDGAPASYGVDRQFVYLRLQDGDPRQERTVAALAAAGFPVVHVQVDHPEAIGAEFFRWEIATAVMGAVMGINPFDQPDVEAAKIETRRLMESVAVQGALPAEVPFFRQDGIELYGEPIPGNSLGEVMRAHLKRLQRGSYFAVLAFLPMTEENELVLQGLRAGVRDARHVATTVGFGPRYLHSTGQAYKGGSPGVFVVLTRPHARDLPVAGRPYSFGIVQNAQARGDAAVLQSRGRPILRVQLGSDVAAGLALFARAIAEALSS